MYETKEKSKDEPGTVKPGDGKEEGTTRSQEGISLVLQCCLAISFSEGEVL